MPWIQLHCLLWTWLSRHGLYILVLWSSASIWPATCLEGLHSCGEPWVIAKEASSYLEDATSLLTQSNQELTTQLFTWITQKDTSICMLEPSSPGAHLFLWAKEPARQAIGQKDNRNLTTTPMYLYLSVVSLGIALWLGDQSSNPSSAIFKLYSLSRNSSLININNYYYYY